MQIQKPGSATAESDTGDLQHRAVADRQTFVEAIFVDPPPGRAFSDGKVVGLSLLAAATIAVGIWTSHGFGESPESNAAVRADDAEANAAADKSGKTESIEEPILELPRVEDLLIGPFLSNIKQPTTLSQGFRFQFPYDGGGAMKTFLVDRPAALYLWPPRVDASTAAGRKAIFQTLHDADQGPHFTMDGKRLLAFNSARIVPFNFKDERLHKAWVDAFRRIPPARLVESVKKRHAAAKIIPGPVDGSYVLPLAEKSFFAALTSDDRAVILVITRKTDEFQYDVGHYLLEPRP